MKITISGTKEMKTVDTRYTLYPPKLVFNN